MGVKRTHYVGSTEVVWEGSNPPAGAGEYRRYIGGVAIATWFAASGIDQVRYLHTDHLGSTTAISDESGQIVARMGFDAWGQRRPEDWAQSPWQQWLNPLTPAWAQTALAITPRGYTGHEHVDGMGIIHMNGRIYDAHLGRFLQADPFVEDSTTLNRYTYVHNNPLSLTDPSGFFSFGGLFKKIGKALSTLGNVISLFPCEGCQAVGSGLASLGRKLRLLGISISQNQSAPPGTLAGAFNSQGTGSFNILPFSPLQDLTPQQQIAQFEALRSLNPNLAGGVIGIVASDRKGHGFAAAGVGDIQFQRHAEDRSAEIAANVSLSGTDSAVTDSKFANGALSTGFWFAAGFIPGVDLTRALLDPDATKVDLTLGAIAVIPGGGKLASLGAKGLKAIVGFGKRLFRRKSSAAQVTRGAANLPFRSGDVILREFQTSRGILDVAAETQVVGRTLHLKDIAVFPRGADALGLGTREVAALRNQLAAEARSLGFEQLRITGTRVSGANPGKAVDIAIDLTK